jgi:hypothetical protein
MKTRLLWALILTVGSTALYFGIARPVVPTLSKRTRDFLETDPATRRPIKLPPFVVSESRLPVTPLEPTGQYPRSHDVSDNDQTELDLAARTPALDASGKNAAPTESEVGAEAKRELER